MELVTTYICKLSDTGVHDNIFGGTILGLIDQSAGLMQLKYVTHQEW